MNRRWFVVSLHDVAAATAGSAAEWMSRLEARGVSVSMLVVPGPWRPAATQRTLADSPDVVDWLRDLEGRGHELVQHGWDHTAAPTWAADRRGPRVRAVGRLVARGCGEFWTLGEHEATRRLVAGREVLRSVGLSAEGFVAPAWLMSPGSRAAVAATGFRYTTTHRHVADVAAGTTIRCLALSQRPQNRLAGLAAALSLAGVRRAIRFDAPLRIAVHPDDLVDRRALPSVLAAIDVATAAGYRSLTYAALLDETAAGHTVPNGSIDARGSEHPA